MMQRRIAACLVVALAVVAACADSGTGIEAGATLQGGFVLQTVDGTPLPIAQRKIVSVDTSGTTTSSCTDYLAEMSIDVTSSGSATRGESHNLVCDGSAAGITTSTLESGRASRTADGWRFDFTGPGVAPSSHYFGRLDGSTLTIVRRETDAMTVRQLLIPATVDLSQLVFDRVP
ncbi:MAG TPA: hypothetical protein VF461_16550 [Gemmatimonadaceae bacterium]